MTHPTSIRIDIDEEKSTKLKNIVKALYESNSINSDDIEEFIKFTVFIVFDEYERDVTSLKKFYSTNLAKYIADKDRQSQIKP